jgi:hypothetical protein
MNSDPREDILVLKKETAGNAARVLIRGAIACKRTFEVMVPLAAERVMRFRNTTRFHLHLHPLSPLWPRCQLLMRHPTFYGCGCGCSGFKISSCRYIYHLVLACANDRNKWESYFIWSLQGTKLKVFVCSIATLAKFFVEQQLLI